MTEYKLSAFRLPVDLMDYYRKKAAEENTTVTNLVIKQLTKLKGEKTASIKHGINMSDTFQDEEERLEQQQRRQRNQALLDRIAELVAEQEDETSAEGLL